MQKCHIYYTPYRNIQVCPGINTKMPLGTFNANGRGQTVRFVARPQFTEDIYPMVQQSICRNKQGANGERKKGKNRF